MSIDKVSIHQSSTSKWNFFRDVIRYAEAGFSSIGICENKIEEFDADECSDFLFEMGMQASSLSTQIGFTGTSGLSFDYALDRAIGLIHLAAELGAKMVVMEPGGRGKHIDSHLERIFHSSLERMLPVAEDHEIRIAFSPRTEKGFEARNFAGSPDRLLRLISRYPAERVGFVVDLFELERTSFAKWDWRDFASRIALVRISDSTQVNGRFVRALPGFGSLPIRSWISRLACHHYDGPIELDWSGPGFDHILHEDILIAAREFALSYCVPEHRPKPENHQKIVARVDVRR